jgi:predicted metalloprotease with PDZ domain
MNMVKTFKSCRVIVVLAALFSLSASIAASQTEEFTYKIRPIPQADRTTVEVSLTFQNGGTQPLAVGLPSDCFGTPDLYKYVTRFEGESGTSVSIGDKLTERIVRPGPDGIVSLRYTLSYDPKVMDAAPYSPNTGPGHFHLAGCQYLLPIGDNNKKRRVRIEIRDVPKGWRIYSTNGENAADLSVESSYEDLSSSAIGGGMNAHIFYTKKARVAVFVHGEFQIPRAKIYSSIEQIVRVERTWFDDHDQPNYTIIVAPRSNVTAGFAPDNAFVCFVDPKTKNEDLSLLVAHEFFHNWLPNKIEVVQDKNYSELRYEWFSEGFTDYFARRILADANLMTADEFAAAVNQTIQNIADNPHRAKTYDELSALGKVGKFDGVAKKLAYYRGMLIALNWDTQIKRVAKGQELADLIRELYKSAAKSNGKISEKTFFALAGTFGIDASGDLERYIMLGEPIIPDEKALGPDYGLFEIEKPAFDTGFSLEETQKIRKISRVRENGPAYKAGLRDGMDFIGIENGYRFSNAWKVDLPLVVKVKINGTEKRVEYFPHGDPVKLAAFRKSTKR